ncbi:polysaccharide deacetylase family protein [uncultured Methylobacterium sp.]|uniref:polysaccharide deacetylase family protein n=1 Tax=uncultured Methylobacterium sp. TaxID=157278 RepID=UPI0035CB85C1
MRTGADQPVPRLRRVVGRVLAWRCARRLAILPDDFRPTVSFTFDDFPASAVEAAVPILRDAGMAATWYAASGLFGQPSPVGTVASTDQIVRLHADGHEIGDHTRRHLDARAVTADAYGRDIDENRRVLAGLLQGSAVRSFAYPFGGVTVGAKRAAMVRAVTCRSTIAGIARGSVDLALLPANPVYAGAASLDSARDVIARVRATGGWAIFYTHDVARAPSPWGCTPDAFAALVAAVARAGLRVGTVGAVAGQIIRPPA